MNRMLELAIKEGHAKRLPSDHDRGGAGNPNVIRKSKLVTMMVITTLKDAVSPMTVRQIADATINNYTTVYSRVRALKASGVVVILGSVPVNRGRCIAPLWGLAETKH
ncbi:MAG: hypothetical protein JKY94_02175 [Rhodobacteraceae bacterium]|nr:hypothetical protein [Paracoccaceae bacterium]